MKQQLLLLPLDRVRKDITAGKVRFFQVFQFYVKKRSQSPRKIELNVLIKFYKIARIDK